MGLRLHPVAARQGAKWITQAFKVWRKRPMAFVGLFMFFLFGVLLLMLIPVVGPLLGLGLLPMLTLGFMIATHSAVQAAAAPGAPLQVGAAPRLDSSQTGMARKAPLAMQ